MFRLGNAKPVGKVVLALAMAACGGKQDATPAMGTGGGSNSGGTQSGGSSAGGSAGNSSSGGSGVGGSIGGGGSGGGVQANSEKMDLLFVVDNSISMANKAKMLAESIPPLIARLTSPVCLAEDGAADPVQPSSAAEACSGSSTREFAPISDMHVGVITTSLGGHGGEICGPTMLDRNVNDGALLIPRVRTTSIGQAEGFLRWGADGLTDPDALGDGLVEMIAAAGEDGCGYEATLEAMYRFLVDPSPPGSVVVNDMGVAEVVGVDQRVLDQRAMFLRPDSAVTVVILTDENDCSIRDAGYGYLLGRTTAQMQPGTSACEADPNDPCCTPCNNVAPLPDGCTPAAEDPQCIAGALTLQADPLNLRCFQQQRRFGEDFLYPLSRYIEGLSSRTLADENGIQRTNPLFETGRDPSLISVLGIVGVPWQALLRDPDQAAQPEFMSAEELHAAGRFEALAGNPDNHVSPSDPLMVESIGPRSGTSSTTGATLVDASSTDPTAAPNGHERMISAAQDDLQYACIAPLESAEFCDDLDNPCDCAESYEPATNPACQPPGGGVGETMQYFSKAYPSLRPLAFIGGLGVRGVVGSACWQNYRAGSAPDNAYNAAFNALFERLRQVLP